MCGHCANQKTGSGCNLLKTGNRLLKTPAPLWPSKFVFVILIKYLACLLQLKTVSRIWWPWNFSFPAAFFTVYSHGKPWRHYLIIYHHLRLNAFLSYTAVMLNCLTIYALSKLSSLPRPLRADVSKYRPEVYKSEKWKILKKIHKVALGKLLT